MTLQASSRERLGLARLVPIAISGGVIGYIAISYLVQAAHWPIGDATSYWEAALRLRSGEPLYVAGIDPEDPVRYLYAPWFAFAWLPLTFLPQQLVFVAWSGVLLVAALLAIRPLLASGTVTGWLTGLMLGSFLVWTASRGNVQPLLILGLLTTLERRSGPFWVGVFASLKLVPIAYAVVWMARGQWLRAFIALAVTATLVLPALLFDISGYTTAAGARPALLPSLPLQVAGVVAAVVITWRLARTRYALLAASALAMLALPRFVEYNVTFAAAGIPERPDQRATVTTRTEC
jgi:hypothetical protein